MSAIGHSSDRSRILFDGSPTAQSGMHQVPFGVSSSSINAYYSTETVHRPERRQVGNQPRRRKVCSHCFVQRIAYPLCMHQAGGRGWMQAKKGVCVFMWMQEHPLYAPHPCRMSTLSLPPSTLFQPQLSLSLSYFLLILHSPHRAVEAKRVP